MPILSPRRSKADPKVDLADGSASRRSGRGFRSRFSAKGRSASEGGGVCSAMSEENAATILQSRARGSLVRRKRSASDSTLVLAAKEQRAATLVQATHRGQHERKRLSSGVGRVKSAVKGAGVRIKDGLSELNPFDAMLDAKETANTKMMQAVVRARHRATVKAARVVIRGFIEGTADVDPWTPAADLETQKQQYLWLLDSCIKRMESAELEEKGIGSARLRHVIRRDRQPSSWPGPPPMFPNFLAWLRAKVLYAMFPADKHQAYFWNVATWGQWVWLAFVFTPFGVSSVAWLLLFSFIILVDDQYMLFNYIRYFKLYALVLWGILPMIGDHFMAYFYLTSPEAVTCHTLGARFVSPLWHGRLFVLNWALCYVAFGAFWLTRKKQQAARRPVNRLLYEKLDSDSSSSDSDDDGGGASSPSSQSSSSSEDEALRRIRGSAPKHRATAREVTLLMKYDLAASLIFGVASFLDLACRLHGVTTFVGLLDEFVTLNREDDALARVHFDYGTRYLALLALPYVIFAIPFVSDVLHQMRPTAFDQEGRLRLMLEPWQMKEKWDDEVLRDKAAARRKQHAKEKAEADASRQAEKDRVAAMKRYKKERRALKKKKTSAKGLQADDPTLGSSSRLSSERRPPSKGSKSPRTCSPCLPADRSTTPTRMGSLDLV